MNDAAREFVVRMLVWLGFPSAPHLDPWLRHGRALEQWRKARETR